ncbi:hypothetical protein [Bradyrhizobium sp. CCGE-LA001]|uniref:hypothetical protein n=1 Tax=Bradyrhizobium sp. CCGE-LA001 TaxID=1223566 RepID=UPI00119821A6|nr:hypothetical protein [Bradyrhizobium sp. CCGE-LA001]
MSHNLLRTFRPSLSSRTSTKGASYLQCPLVSWLDALGIRDFCQCISQRTDAALRLQPTGEISRRACQVLGSNEQELAHVALGFSEGARRDHPSAIIVLIDKKADDHANEISAGARS